MPENNLEYIVRFNTKQDGEDFVAATSAIDSDTKVAKWIRDDIAVIKIKDSKILSDNVHCIAKYAEIPHQQVRRF